MSRADSRHVIFNKDHFPNKVSMELQPLLNMILLSMKMLFLIFLLLPLLSFTQVPLTSSIWSHFYLHLLSCEVSLRLLPPLMNPSHHHSMTTRSQTGSLKLRQILELSDTSYISHIPWSTSQALYDPNWKTAMDNEMEDLT